MEMDAYDALDAEYLEAELYEFLLRLVQSETAEQPLSKEAVETARAWLQTFQRTRDLVALILRGMVFVRVVNGEVAVQANTGTRLPTMTELIVRGELPPNWLDHAPGEGVDG